MKHSALPAVMERVEDRVRSTSIEDETRIRRLETRVGQRQGRVQEQAYASSALSEGAGRGWLGSYGVQPRGSGRLCFVGSGVWAGALKRSWLLADEQISIYYNIYLWHIELVAAGFKRAYA